MKEGGGLLLVAVGWSWVSYTNRSLDSDPANQIGRELGISVNDDVIYDPTDNTGNPSSPLFHKFVGHPITAGLTEIGASEYLPSSLNVWGNGKAVILGDDDAYASDSSGLTYAKGSHPPFVAVAEYGEGRVVFIGHEGIFSNQNLHKYDNLKLALNIFRWLSHSEGKGTTVRTRTQPLGPPGTYVEIFWNRDNNYEFDWDVEVTDAPDSVEPGRVIFWAHQFAFMGGNGGYVGIQIVGPRKKAIFSIWDAITGVPGSSFEEDGTGWHIVMDYNWKLNRKYRLRIWLLGINGNGNRWWAASIYDYATGKETMIGRILVPSSWGGLTSHSITWTEYAGYGRCNPNDVPYTRAVFSNLFAYSVNGNGPPDRLRVSYGTSRSSNSDVDYYGGTTYVLEAGDDVTRDTPEGWLKDTRTSPMSIRISSTTETKTTVTPTATFTITKAHTPTTPEIPTSSPTSTLISTRTSTPTTTPTSSPTSTLSPRPTPAIAFPPTPTNPTPASTPTSLTLIYLLLLGAVLAIFLVYLRRRGRVDDEEQALRTLLEG